MLLSNDKRLIARVLVMYLISALLFVTSIELHVHVSDDAIAADQSSQIHISSVTGTLGSPDVHDEVDISPLGVLKSNQNDLGVMAVFLLLILAAVLSSRICIARIREVHACYPRLPFHGTPSLRAPPSSSS